MINDDMTRTLMNQNLSYQVISSKKDTRLSKPKPF